MSFYTKCKMSECTNPSTKESSWHFVIPYFPELPKLQNVKMHKKSSEPKGSLSTLQVNHMRLGHDKSQRNQTYVMHEDAKKGLYSNYTPCPCHSGKMFCFQVSASSASWSATTQQMERCSNLKTKPLPWVAGTRCTCCCTYLRKQCPQHLIWIT